MTFSFSYSIKPSNLWVLSLINIYRSFMGAVNIVFTASMIMLALHFWPDAHPGVRVLLLAAVLFFPVFQPFMIYLRSRKIVASMPDNLRIEFDNIGLTVTAGDQVSRIEYSHLRSIIRISGMLILYTRTRQGYILNRQVLKNREAELFRFLEKQLTH